MGAQRCPSNTTWKSATCCISRAVLPRHTLDITLLDSPGDVLRQPLRSQTSAKWVLLSLDRVKLLCLKFDAEINHILKDLSSNKLPRSNHRIPKGEVSTSVYIELDLLENTKSEAFKKSQPVRSS
ncbi:hypothetical protein NPIL_491041 [Nephila pilipes]|uniref:Uncharacterized protein n=1 Tax=Nephila pilipes TaxID=299642 RepID=A0A8X6NFD9_NEPPI|nr:hypothetical protein NPIL_491041 [Nephila pilipes]